MNAVHIVVAMKPIEGNYAENALAVGVVGINVDGSRVEGDEKLTKHIEKYGNNSDYGKDAKTKFGQINSNVITGNSKGRWPSNVILDGSDEVVEKFPETTSGKPGIKRGENNGQAYGAESRTPGTQMSGFGDSGSAARFFKECKV